MRILQSFMREHVENARTKFKGDSFHTEKVPQFTYYLQRAYPPETNCLIFNTEFINIFQTICEMYNPTLLERYAFIPVSAKFRNDIGRKRRYNGDKQSLSHSYVNLITLEKSEDENYNLNITPIVPYHSKDNSFSPLANLLLKIDFTDRSVLDSILNLDKFTDFKESLIFKDPSRFYFLETFLSQDISHYSMNDKLLYLSLIMHYSNLSYEAADEAKKK